MKLCGLTGGVGMGKSTAAGFLRQRGVRVVDTDQIARDLVQPGHPVLSIIQNMFGGGILTDGGELNRAELARLVFNDSEARQQLEALMHPLIFERWQTQSDLWRREGVPLAFVDIPLLFETKVEGCFDKIVCVACSPARQRLRLLERGWSPGQIRQRIAAQLKVEEKIHRAHYVMWTEGALEVHACQVDLVLQRIS